MLLALSSSRRTVSLERRPLCQPRSSSEQTPSVPHSQKCFQGLAQDATFFPSCLLNYRAPSQRLQSDICGDGGEKNRALENEREKTRALAYSAVQIPLDFCVYTTFFPSPSLFPPIDHFHSCHSPRTQTPANWDAAEWPACFWREQRDTHALRLCHTQLFHFRGLKARLGGAHVSRWAGAVLHTPRDHI